jgi:hypothetical protein
MWTSGDEFGESPCRNCYKRQNECYNPPCPELSLWQETQPLTTRTQNDTFAYHTAPDLELRI